MQKLSLTSYFIAFIIVFETIHGKGSEGRNSLIKLLELQKSHCGTVSLCTIKSENNGSLQMPPTTCCKHCSCDAACVEKGTCCPDYKLGNKMDDILLTNISDLFNRLPYFNDTYWQSMQERDLTLEQTPKQHTECVKANAAKDQFHYDSPRMLNYYWMVNTCPYDIDGSHDTASKCTDDVNLSPKSSQNEHGISVPVTSLKTNRTYKNVYCFQCNELESSMEDLWPWRAIYVCVNMHRIVLFDNPYKELQETASTDQRPFCNVFYKPRPQTQHLVARCDPVDVNTCPESADKQLDEICNAYYLPVIDIEVGHFFKNYRNIACYLCNKENTFQSDCTYLYPNSVEYSVEMNLLLDKQYNTVLRYNESEQHVLNVSINTVNNSACKTGFILSNDLVKCKRVLCPRHFYPLKGSCFPAFTQTENIYFTVIMEVLRVQKVNQATRDDFHRDYSNIVSRTAAALFERFTFGMWQMTDDYDFLVISFTMPSETTYASMLTSLSKFLAQIASLKINTQSTTVDVVTLVSKESSTMLFDGQIIKNGNTRSPLTQLKAYRGFEKSLTEKRISWSHLCYRTEIGRSEMYMDNRGNYRINNTGGLLFAVDIQELLDDKFIVCIGDAYHSLTDVKASYMFGGSSAIPKAQYLKLKNPIKPVSSIIGKDENQPDTDIKTVDHYITDLAKGVVITVTFVVVITIICGTRLLKHRRDRRLRRDATDE